MSVTSKLKLSCLIFRAIESGSCRLTWTVPSACLKALDDMGELLFEQESFTQPARICRYSPKDGRIDLWVKRTVPFDSREFGHSQVWFPAKDGISIPMYLVGRRQDI